jgi:hypothetical protein
LECATVGNLERCLIAATPTPLTMIRSERDGRLIKTKVETHRKPCASLGKTALSSRLRGGGGAPPPPRGRLAHVGTRSLGCAAGRPGLFRYSALGLGGGGVFHSVLCGCENGGWARCEVDPVRLV